MHSSYRFLALLSFLYPISSLSAVWNRLWCPAPDKMPYCCVPRCKSSSKQRTPGISFHEIPSDPELCAKWLKVISRENWVPNTTSCCSTVCSRHFSSSDFKEGCEIRKLKKDAIPSIFEEYPAYLQPPKKRDRSYASVKKREAAALANPPPPKRRAVIDDNQMESCPHPLYELPVVDVVFEDLSPVDCTATEPLPPVKNGASERCITATLQMDRAVQVSSQFSVSTVDKRKWRRKERDLNEHIERLKNTVDNYKQEIQKLKEECFVHAFLQVVEKAKEKDLAASVLVEQVKNFGKMKPTWSDLSVRHAVVLRNLSTRAYEHIRTTGILRLPSRSTLERFMGVAKSARRNSRSKGCQPSSLLIPHRKPERAL
nr:THAP domain-containing protein 1-like [Dermacentor andersoni]